MMRLLLIVLAIFTIVSAVFSQGTTKTLPNRVPVKETAESVPAAKGAEVRTFRDDALGFAITFPEPWVIAGEDFEERMLAEGFDLSLKAPEGIGNASKIQVDRALERVKVLVTAFRSGSTGSQDNAIIRVAAEDLTPVPEVKDAVDYFDLMRSQFAVMKLPKEFEYSETQAEQLGARQYAFLDTHSGTSKKRMYATVRRRTALIFTLSYTADADLRTFRQIMSAVELQAK